MNYDQQWRVSTGPYGPEQTRDNPVYEQALAAGDEFATYESALDSVLRAAGISRQEFDAMPVPETALHSGNLAVVSSIAVDTQLQEIQQLEPVAA